MNTPRSPHQQRVIDELDQLDDKIKKLNVFITENPVFNALPEQDKLALKFQRETMQTYANILLYRISRFK